MVPKIKSFKLYTLLALFICSLAGYGVIGYGINRTQFGIFIAMFAILFVSYLLTVKHVTTYPHLQWAIGAAILFRLILLFVLPNLSDDFYRFIWDGNLLANGINPFAHTPAFYMKTSRPDFLSVGLFNHLNSQNYYTVYPPVCQYIFAFSAKLFGSSLRGNVVVMKTIMLAADLGTFWVIKKLLEHFKLSLKYLLIYALNPLIILELTGNLHFEGIMIFFLLLGYYLFIKQKLWLAAICFLLAVNTKLVPLILLPYLVFSLGWKRSFGLITILGAGTIALHLPFLDQTFIGHFSDSLGLYFQSFEFNASLYYLVRWVGFQLKGYDIIHTAAPVLSIISTAIIIAVSWIYSRKSLKNLPVIYVVLLGIYYLFATTVQPWYVSSLIAFVPLAGVFFPLAWSGLIPLSYITYLTAAYNENLWLVTVEYIVVFGVIGYDLYHRKQQVGPKIHRIFDSVHSFTK